ACHNRVRLRHCRHRGDLACGACRRCGFGGRGGELVRLADGRFLRVRLVAFGLAHTSTPDWVHQSVTTGALPNRYFPAVGECYRTRPRSCASALSEVSGRAPRCWITSAAASAPRLAARSWPAPCDTP